LTPKNLHVILENDSATSAERLLARFHFQKSLVGLRPGLANLAVLSTYGSHPRNLYPFFDKFLIRFQSSFPTIFGHCQQTLPEAFSRWYMSLPLESTHLLSEDIQRAARKIVFSFASQSLRNQSPTWLNWKNYVTCPCSFKAFP
jgi:hypothetical protein